MMLLATNLLILATEDGVPPEHIGAKIALPLGLLFFCGSVYLLLWAIYGARKGGLVYLTAFFGFNVVLGVFWWFGAPGTVVATGLRNFPGQPADAYAGKWFAFEENSDRAEFFPDLDSLEDLEDPVVYAGGDPQAPEEELQDDPKVAFIRGDLDQASNKMIDLFLPTDESDQPRLGADRRSRIEEVVAEQRDEVVESMTAPRTILNAEGNEEEIEGAVEGSISRATPFLTARVATTEDGELVRGIDDVNDHRLAGARLELVANFIGQNPEERPIRGELVVEQQEVFAFKDPGALWFPSAIWTLISMIGFVISSYALDAMEQREKRRREERVEEPMDVTVGAPA